MSYILDALRRADAERQRGGVPGLHAQAVLPAGPDSVAPRRGVPLAWVLAGAAVLLAGVAIAWLSGRDSVAPAPAHATAAMPAVSAAAEPATTDAGGARPPPELPPPPAATPPPNVAEPSPQAAVPPRAAAPVVADPAAPSVALAAPRAASATTPARPTPYESLPEPLRKQMPAIALGGGVYAEQAAQRLVLVNGQVAREGDQLGADLQLLRILPRSVILSFRGQPFEMKF